VIPDTAKEKPQQGQIVAAGNGRRWKDGAIIPLHVHVGDRTIFGTFAGNARRRFPRPASCSLPLGLDAASVG
jgi:chaperonin GroES